MGPVLLLLGTHYCLMHPVSAEALSCSSKQWEGREAKVSASLVASVAEMGRNQKQKEHTISIKV